MTTAGGRIDAAFIQRPVAAVFETGPRGPQPYSAVHRGEGSRRQSGHEFYWRNYARAPSAVAQVPSILSGRPTITASGCHSLSSFSIDVPVRFASHCAFGAGNGRAVAVMRCPTAADAFGAKVKAEKGSAHHACPATPGIVTMSIPISLAASRQRHRRSAYGKNIPDRAGAGEARHYLKSPAPAALSPTKEWPSATQHVARLPIGT